MSNTTAPVGNDANLAEAITYAEYILNVLCAVRADNAAADYVLANGRLTAVTAAVTGLMHHVDAVHDDLVWRVR